MMYLNWILLVVCVGLVVWPLLVGGRDRHGEGGERP